MSRTDQEEAMVPVGGVKHRRTREIWVVWTTGRRDQRVEVIRQLVRLGRAGLRMQRTREREKEKEETKDDKHGGTAADEGDRRY